MITLLYLQQYLNKLMNFDKRLDAAKIDSMMCNGLMVKGKEEIKKIGFGVSASIALFEKAKENGCDVIIVHHSFNFPPVNRYDRIFQNRIAFLIKNDISLFGYHFLLDSHPEVGNNVEILRTIGAKPTVPFYHRGDPWGWVGEFSNAQELERIVELLNKYLTPGKIIYDFGPAKIRKVVAVSGSGAPYPSDMEELVKDNIDLFIAGEAHEWNRELCKEAGINFIAGGHYHTEMFGIKSLMKTLEKEFKGLETVWLDLMNEV
jgi:dinuclear metal center YbgI/SA1388 family protein